MDEPEFLEVKLLSARNGTINSIHRFFCPKRQFKEHAHTFGGAGKRRNTFLYFDDPLVLKYTSLRPTKAMHLLKRSFCRTMTQ
jgi:hypothetical protein